MNSRSFSVALSEIIGVAVEHDLHLDPNRFIQYLDLYRVYIGCTERAEDVSVDSHTSFYEFISSQALLNYATSMAAVETGERLIAPAACQLEEKSDAKDGSRISSA